MSFLSFLSPAITAASDVAGGYEQGQQKVKAQQIAQAQLAAKEKRQSALDILNARNINSEIATRAEDKNKPIFDQDGNPWRLNPDGKLARVPVTDTSAPAPISPTSATGGPSGDINLGSTSPSSPAAPVAPGPTKSSDAGPAVAPPTPVPQGTAPPKQSAPQGTAPKFGPRKPPDPVATAVAIAKATKGIPTYGDTHPRDSYTFGTAGIDPATGQPTIYKGNTKSGELTSTGIGKPVAGQGAQNAPQMAAAKANMESAMKTMDDYEAKLRQHPEIYGVPEATMGAMASSPSALNATGAFGALHSLSSNAASSHLQSSNPELARYLTAKKFVAEAILNTHKRPNQTQYEIEQELGGVGPNPSPMQIDMVAARRNRMYQEVFANPAAGGTVSAAATAAHPAGVKKPALTQAQYDAGIAKGHTPAEIASHYDLSQVKQ